VGSAYSVVIAASGGITPYSWSLTGGTLPTGLGLDASSGQISGTPTQSGTFPIVVQVKDSSSPAQTASQGFGIVVAAGGTQVSITTTSLPAGQVGQVYLATLEAGGGTPPDTWSIVSGLPAGLTLTPSNGQITGTPTTADPYTVTVKVTDSSSPTNTATKGLSLTVWSDSGNSSSAWSIQTTATGWHWLAPSGWGGPASYCRVNGLSLVDDTMLQNAGTDAAVLTKYGGSRAAESQAWSTRMQSQGFNFAGFGSYSYDENWSSGMLAVESFMEGSDYVMDDGHPWHVKNVAAIDYQNGQVCAYATYKGGNQADVYDPEFAVAWASLLSGGRPSNVIFTVPDDGDYLFGLNTNGVGNRNAHPELGWFVLTGPPFQKKSHCPDCNTTGTYSYPNQTVYAKLGLRDYLLNEYLCAGPGTPFADCTAAHLGTGSADPSSSSYVGASNASTALAAFNAAWGTSYTTWNTSDPNGLAGIANGTYTSWGGVAACIASGNPYSGCTGSRTGSGIAQGTGFLDENGSHIIPNSFNCGGADGNGPLNSDSWTNNGTIKSDLHLYVAQFAALYAEQVQAGYKAGCGSNCPPLAMPVYDGPPYVYAAMAPYTDLFWVDAPLTDLQTIINNDGGKPVVNEDYSVADPDSPGGGNCKNHPYGNDCYLTQALRGAAMANKEMSEIAIMNPNQKHAVIGFEHWSLFDNYTGGGAWVANFGIATKSDNLYDGSASSTAMSSGACGASHAYTQPAICQDPNANSEGLAVTSCTSGSTAPSWNAAYGGVTLDGTCQWVNEGSYTRIPETNDWGDAILPLYNEAQTGMCDTD
jgi:hypothetical protein